MKKSTFWIIMSIELLMVLSFGIHFYNEGKEKSYCGKVIAKYSTDAGYKIYPTKHVVFYSNTLLKNIDIEVTDNTYWNTNIGEIVCFNLNKCQVR